MMDVKNSEKEYCSTSEAAQRLGLSLGTVQQMVETGQLEGWKTAGGHRRIRKASVDAFLTRAQTGGGTAPVVRNSGQTLAVIVAEDDPILQELYRHTFDNWALPVRLSILGSGFDALLEVGRNPPDLLISDLKMPGMDGFEMIRRIRENPLAADMDIIAVTGLSAEEIAEQGGLPGDITVYAKPVPFRELRGYLQALVARRKRS